jgi:hypothetical protein
MFLSAYRFDGNPTDLLAAYERLMSEIPTEDLLLQVCAVGDDGLTVVDACPDRATHDQFVADPGFRDALARAGLPAPRIEVFGDVPHAWVSPSAVTVVGSSVSA